VKTLLDAATSIKVKLGALVAISVVVVALLATLGSSAGVPVWLTLPVAVLLTLGVTQLLAAGMVSPLRSMTEVAQQMARGDYTGRVRTTSTDEVGRLAAVFNQMAGDLALVEAERRDLIATVSHELRTPLAAMIAVLENLADGVVPADARQRPARALAPRGGRHQAAAHLSAGPRTRGRLHRRGRRRRAYGGVRPRDRR
jgi:two-component system, OmpR family, sensor histidine kinase BaeS